MFIYEESRTTLTESYIIIIFYKKLFKTVIDCYNKDTVGRSIMIRSYKLKEIELLTRQQKLERLAELVIQLSDEDIPSSVSSSGEPVLPSPREEHLTDHHQDSVPSP